MSHEAERLLAEGQQLTALSCSEMAMVPSALDLDEPTVEDIQGSLEKPEIGLLELHLLERGNRRVCRAPGNSIHASSAPSSATAEPTRSPYWRAYTKACWLACTTWTDTPCRTPPEPRPLARRARAEAGSAGSSRSISVRPSVRPSRPAPPRRTCRRPCGSSTGCPRRRRPWPALDGVHRREAHRRHHEAHADAHQHEARQQGAVAAGDREMGLPEQRCRRRRADRR